ncbi:hypothetical protein QNI19_36000 [Cytophagaceae bacterium DM2B3-1]|uniref:Uncharacterized protein n=1 Tax=Xanthocytophaga flava TaxID=3048013 RepID=A0ABT7CX92_9BACT|nr:hypothetical protein [Xanthocytophaga flavus]MDJ1498394.1 hypothetical protein [Xanthocytophaga flavus]
MGYIRNGRLTDPNHSWTETGQGQAQPLRYRKCTNAVCGNQGAPVCAMFRADNGWIGESPL